MNAWPGSMTRNTIGEIPALVLSTFKSGRLYNRDDVRRRCKDKGVELSPDAVKSALHDLVMSKAIVIDRYSHRAVPTSYRLAE